MAESQIAQKVQEMLNEEKWTRASLSAYSAANLKELDAIAQDALRDKAIDEVKDLCDEHLSHTKTSIIALYLSGIFALMRQQIDDSAMVALLDLFADNKKWSVVEFVCLRILDYGENRIALRRLAESYESDGRPDDMHVIWERLIRVDYEEADIVKALAEKREKEGKVDEAVDFYKKALHRYINKGLSTNVKEIWGKLVEYCPEDIDFFFHVQRKIAKQISEDKAAGLLLDLFRHYKEKEDWNTALDILKVVIDYDEKNPSLRKDVIECYKGKYKDHSHLEDYIRLSNIAQSYRAMHEAMADFEKHIAFDAGNFVYHRTWNIGRIASIKGDDIVIDFAKSRGHKMSLKMAIDSLTTLSKEHIWVLKAVWSKDKLREKVKSDPGLGPAYHHQELRQPGRPQAHQGRARPLRPHRERMEFLERQGPRGAEDRLHLRQRHRRHRRPSSSATGRCPSRRRSTTSSRPRRASSRGSNTSATSSSRESPTPSSSPRCSPSSPVSSAPISRRTRP